MRNIGESKSALSPKNENILIFDGDTFAFVKNNDPCLHNRMPMCVCVCFGGVMNIAKVGAPYALLILKINKDGGGG